VEGGFTDFGPDSIIIGQELARDLGTFLGDRVKVLSSETQMTPMGAAPRSRTFVVSGIFSSGLYEYDNAWAYVSMESAQRLLGLGDVAAGIDVKVTDIYQARQIGQEIVSRLGSNVDFTDWIAMNESIFQALRMERLVMFITIGLIVIVAALNILATLIMMVLEKTRDVGILMSMGATQQNIRRIFIYQGVIIGIVGTVLGVILGQMLSYFADAYRLISLAPEVYPITYVPFKAQILDSVVVAASAVVISFLATLYPSAAASRLQPVESLRYE
jgi:lipoprotein-releasing system permease protein